MKQNILDFIRAGKRCFDGATGTMLMRLGLGIGGCPEEVPEDLMSRVHKEYITAGAHFITTNTFGGNRLKLMRYAAEGRLAGINSRNVKIARAAAADSGVFVAGDIGPTGEFIEPYGDYTPEQMEDVFWEQAAVLAESGADLIIIETMSALEEMAAAIRASRRTQLPVIATMTFNRNPGGEFRTMMGVTPEDAVRLMSEEGADVVGANCSLTPSEMADLAALVRPIVNCPLIVQPNAGRPRVENGVTVYDPIEDLDGVIRSMSDAGADIIGGCCGTDPEYVRAVRRILDGLSN